ncbi:serine/threonine protein kinase [Aurantimicrobium minutum]|uniref:protein kinase domain-containing protein n=1 Tax=Aurantimicrobium minutum TaxID=708131 RepID=UPI0024067AA7|nr:protein kinase [Aurantimicrobium minutum]MDF9809683.1 serine/threonine protein kinase [Aurantimicrobium minutum]
MFSRFAMGGLLGSGGSASVFQAVDSLTGDAVALKVLHPRLAARPELVERFLAEAEKIQNFNHPNVTQVIDWGVEETGKANTAWIAYELAKGISLAEYVELHHRLSPEDAVIVAQAILSALSGLHSSGLVHRDISPQNIIIDKDSDLPLTNFDIRMIDFGLVGIAGSSTKNGSGVVGNAHFTSPEQAKGDGVYQSGDIYQVGAVLYFALTGQTPFSADTVEGLIQAHSTSAPPVPSAKVEGIPRELDRVVVKAMLKSPTMRYRNAEEFNRSLSAIYGRTEQSRDEGQVSESELGQTKVLPAGIATTHVDLDRTMLLSAAYSESLQAESAKKRGLPRRRIRVAPWLWPAGFVLLFALTVTVSIASAQPKNNTAAILAQSQAPTNSPPRPTQSSVSEPTVPNLASLSLAQAREAIKAAGLIVGQETYQDAASPLDQIISSTPEAGSVVRSGTTVSLVVASGRNSVPQVAGMGQTEALAQLAAAGFKISLIGTDGVPMNPAQVLPAARVLQLKPNGGSILRVGSSVIVVISSGDAVPSTHPSNNPAIPVESATPTTSPNPTQ